MSGWRRRSSSSPSASRSWSGRESPPRRCGWSATTTAAPSPPSIKSTPRPSGSVVPTTRRGEAVPPPSSRSTPGTRANPRSPPSSACAATTMRASGSPPTAPSIPKERRSASRASSWSTSAPATRNEGAAPGPRAAPPVPSLRGDLRQERVGGALQRVALEVPVQVAADVHVVVLVHHDAHAAHVLLHAVEHRGGLLLDPLERAGVVHHRHVVVDHAARGVGRQRHV